MLGRTRKIFPPLPLYKGFHSLTRRTTAYLTSAYTLKHFPPPYRKESTQVITSAVARHLSSKCTRNIWGETYSPLHPPQTPKASGATNPITGDEGHSALWEKFITLNKNVGKLFVRKVKSSTHFQTFIMLQKTLLLLEAI